MLLSLPLATHAHLYARPGPVRGAGQRSGLIHRTSDGHVFASRAAVLMLQLDQQAS